MSTAARIWMRPRLWDLTAPPHLAVAGMVLRWVHQGSRWRARIVYGLMIWHLIGFLVLVIAGPAFADPQTQTTTTKPNPADVSMFGWIDVKDSSNIPISQYFIAVDEGNAFSLIPGMGEDKKANIALAPILEFEYGLFKITCQIALWILGYGLGFQWLDFIAKPFSALGAATESLTHSTAILTLALTVAGGVAAFAVQRGRFSKAAYQVGAAVVITTLLATLFAHPVAALVGHDGYLAKARDVGVSSASALTKATGSSPAGSPTDISHLQTALADGFVRIPTQMLNFNASADRNGCKDVWNTGIRSGFRDKLKDDIAKCGAAGKKMKDAADHLSGDRLASAAAIGLLAAILLAFGCYLIGKIVLTTVIALCNAIMLPIVGAAGVVAGGLQGMAFKCLCNIGLALIKLPVTVVYAGAYAALLHSIFQIDRPPMEILLMATVLLLVAIVAFRRLSAGLSNSGGSILNFLNRGGGSATELPKPPLPTALRRGSAIAMQAGGAALGVPPSVTGLAIAGARRLRGTPPSTGPAAHAPDPQTAWWAQQHQWYGATNQWSATNNPTPTPTVPTTNPSVSTTPDPPPSTPATQLLQQLPALHPAVAGAVGAMPQQMQAAGSLPSYQSPRRRPPQTPAASAPPTHERARAASAAATPPQQQHPPTTQRSRQRSTPAVATSAPRAPRKRVTDVINTR